MIADARFGASNGGVRGLQFAPRAPLPVEAACAVANEIRETLRELLGGCELDLGEPAALDPQSWERLARGAQLFLVRGRRTDVVLVVPRRDARRLVLRAFGESEPAAAADAACSALELQAIERIAARCAPALGALCAQHASLQRVAAEAAPPCVAYFDLRVRAPVELTMGVGIVRDVPEPAPPGTLPPAALAEVALEVRAVFAEGMIDAADFVTIRPGDVVKLDTKVGAPASLQVGIPAPGHGSRRRRLFAHRLSVPRSCRSASRVIMTEQGKNLDLLMNVRLKVTAELGTCKMLVRDILKLGAGSIVELDRLAGGPVDLLVNDRLVARGEVVAIDENFGVRITELIEKP